MSMAISVSEALRHEPQPGRTYIPRIIHVDAETIRRKLIGAASHIAWKILAGKYQMIRLRLSIPYWDFLVLNRFIRQRKCLSS